MIAQWRRSDRVCSPARNSHHLPTISLIDSSFRAYFDGRKLRSSLIDDFSSRLWRSETTLRFNFSRKTFHFDSALSAQTNGIRMELKLIDFTLRCLNVRFIRGMPSVGIFCILICAQLQIER